MVTKIIQMVAFSVIPLVGILFFEWSWREVLLLYWLENITVGIVHVITMLRMHDTPTPLAPTPGAGTSHVAARVVLAVFFCIHYGMFTSGHGIFVLAITSGVYQGPGAEELPAVQWGVLLLLWLIVTIVRTAIASSGPRPEGSLKASLTAPYKRIVVLHGAIILGVFVIIGLGLPSAAAIVLIILHALIDLASATRLSNRLIKRAPAS